ncbi:MAG TPA: transglutaminase-like domain-containing protein, partial [Stellaceae bacterium]|nr:transglutaminase-like domain-containing protein [Stellaceae bacterium]
CRSCDVSEMTIAPPKNYDAESRARFLRELGASQEPVLPIAEAALALASVERARVDLGHYRDHLRLLARALNEIILLKYGYSGDELTYDDLQNANLMRVVDRRKGLPVVLGILYIHAARAQGWDMVGLAFPGHFLVRLADGAERLILDPFHGGRSCGAVELRDLLKALSGQEQELLPEHYAPVSDRDILLRLQNNIKARLLQTGQSERALAVVEMMQLLAPDLPALLYEAGAIAAQLGNLRSAIASFEAFVARTPDGAARYQAAALLQQLKSRLQ